MNRAAANIYSRIFGFFLLCFSTSPVKMPKLIRKWVSNALIGFSLNGSWCELRLSNYIVEIDCHHGWKKEEEEECFRALVYLTEISRVGVRKLTRSDVMKNWITTEIVWPVALVRSDARAHSKLAVIHIGPFILHAGVCYMVEYTTIPQPYVSSI